MLKSGELVKDLENRAGAVTKDLLAQVPAFQVEQAIFEPDAGDRRADLVVHFSHASEERVFVCEVKSIAQPPDKHLWVCIGAFNRPHDPATMRRRLAH
jgi:hypothetical protein